MGHHNEGEERKPSFFGARDIFEKNLEVITFEANHHQPTAVATHTLELLSCRVLSISSPHNGRLWDKRKVMHAVVV